MAEKESYYDYEPSVAAAGIFVAIFAILGVMQTFRTRTWFCIPFGLGALLEVIGYLCRGLGNSKPDVLILYIIQTLFILLAPILFAASVYMFLARIMRATNATHHSIIRINWVTKIFVGGDVLCFVIQGAGGGILAGADTQTSLDLGKGVILTGLCLQVVIFAFFMVVAAIWQKRMRGSKEDEMTSFNWLIYLQMLYVVSVLITVRNLFRVIEYAMGPDAYLLMNEWPIYVFDAFLMAIVLAICTRWYVADAMRKAQNEGKDNEGNNVEMLTQSDAGAC
ncbi:unnamed protein product [Cercospora beticola]|nr:unnamed protein product [Cercospora beticola]